MRYQLRYVRVPPTRPACVQNFSLSADVHTYICTVRPLTKDRRVASPYVRSRRSPRARGRHRARGRTDGRSRAGDHPLALLDGRPPAHQRAARLAAVSPPTASAHLAKLDGGLVTVIRQGRQGTDGSPGTRSPRRSRRCPSSGRLPVREPVAATAGGAPPRLGPAMTTWPGGPGELPTPCCARACWPRRGGQMPRPSRSGPPRPKGQSRTWPPHAIESPGAGRWRWHRLG